MVKIQPAISLTYINTVKKSKKEIQENAVQFNQNQSTYAITYSSKSFHYLMLWKYPKKDKSEDEFTVIYWLTCLRARWSVS